MHSKSLSDNSGAACRFGRYPHLAATGRGWHRQRMHRKMRDTSDVLTTKRAACNDDTAGDCRRTERSGKELLAMQERPVSTADVVTVDVAGLPSAFRSVEDDCDSNGNKRDSSTNPFPPERLTARSCKEFDSSYKKGKGVRSADRTCSKRARGLFCKRSPLQLLLRYLPLIGVLRNYDVKRDLASDIVAGLSVSVLHTGQGLGYSALAGLPPVYGIYVSFFHVAIYAFLGTSNHMSVGTYSLTSLLIGAVLEREITAVTGLATPGVNNATVTTAAVAATAVNATVETVASTIANAPSVASTISDWSASATWTTATIARANVTSSMTTIAGAALSKEEQDRIKLGIATTMSLLVGVFLSILGLLRFGGIIANFISPVFISAFTCASAFHIASSQLKYAAFGKHHYIGNYSGPLKLYYLWRDFFVNFLHINWVCSICFLVSMAILFAVKIGINKNKRFRHKLLVPVPVDLVVIVAFTVASYYFTFEALPEPASGVEVIGKMPVGLPTPSVPSFYNWTNYVGDSFIISILVFLFNYTMANFFKEKHKYKINEDQEMLAPGVYHVVSAFFSCFPGSASPPRCFLQDAAGCKTQLSGLISCVVLVVVLYAIAPYLYYLPFAVIAALICASLKRLMLQVRDLKAYWNQDKIDFAVWLVTFLATFVLDIELGMIVGIAFHVFTVALRVQFNRVYAVGRVDHDAYEDVTKYRVTNKENSGNGSVGVDDNEALRSAIRDVVIVRYNSPILFVNSSRFVKLVTKVVQTERAANKDLEAVVVDCTHVSFIDTAAVKAFVKMRKALGDNGVGLYFSGCSPQVRRLLNAGDPTLFHLAFLTIRDVELHLMEPRRVSVEIEINNDKAAG